MAVRGAAVKEEVAVREAAVEREAAVAAEVAAEAPEPVEGKVAAAVLGRAAARLRKMMGQNKTSPMPVGRRRNRHGPKRHARPNLSKCPPNDPQKKRATIEAHRRWETGTRAQTKPGVVDAIVIADALTRRPATTIVSASPSDGVRRLNEPNIDIFVVFDFDLASISPIALAQLEEISKALKSPKLKDFNILVEGHTDNFGSEQYNQALSLRRAAAAREFLISLYAVASGRLSIRGMGETAPIDTNETAAGRHRNRRVTFINFDFGECRGLAG